ncbi:MAG: M24 family metallopeptidase [Bilifractor sp.]
MDKGKRIAPLCGADAMLITDPFNMRYLSGFRGGEGILFISRESRVLITDSRYTEAAAAESDFTVEEESRKLPRSEIVLEYVRREEIGSIGYEDSHMRCCEFSRLKAKLPESIQWIPLGEKVNDLRAVKSEEEIELLRKAEAIGDAAFADILKFIRKGMSELEIAAELEYRMKKHGAQGFSFDTIIASGPNSSMPHAIPSERKLRDGDFVTMDFGCRYEGYCSDMTRTIAIGSISEKQEEIYSIVLEAQNAALSNLRAGITGEVGDQFARSVIQSGGYGNCFGHALGHSVGLFIHENPRLGPGSADILKPNMIETVEPGIYVPGFCGVRIEDMVVIREDGIENLTHSPKDLIIL